MSVDWSKRPSEVTFMVESYGMELAELIRSFANRGLGDKSAIVREGTIKALGYIEDVMDGVQDALDWSCR